MVEVNYAAILPDPEFAPLVSMLEELDALAAKEYAAETVDLKRYLPIVSARVNLLTVAGLTPKSRKQITGEAQRPGPTQEETGDDEFLDS